MTEREKMLAGYLYDCGDAQLLSQWHKAKDLIRDYNQTDSANIKEKERILASCWAERERICGLQPRFMSIMGIIFILEIIVK